MDINCEQQKQNKRGTISINETQGPPQILFQQNQRVLTVGDGDLTFSLSLSNWFWYQIEKRIPNKDLIKKRNKVSPPIDMVVTSYDKHEDLLKMYHPSIEKTIKDLIRNKCKIFYQIDATQLNNKDTLCIIDDGNQKFDRIVWNFPHGGFPQEEKEDDHKGPGFEWTEKFNQMHQQIIQEFLDQAQNLLKDKDSMIIITNKSIEPFSLWDIPGMAQKAGKLKLSLQMAFDFDSYPGYQNRKGAGKNAGKRFSCDEAQYYCFQLIGEEDNIYNQEEHKQL